MFREMLSKKSLENKKQFYFLVIHKLNDLTATSIKLSIRNKQLNVKMNYVYTNLNYWKYSN